MKNTSFFAILAFALSLILSGCQTTLMPSAGGVVRTEDSVLVPSGQNSGEWKGHDLLVDYDYSLTQGGMDMSGVVRFDDHLTYNYTLLRSFQLNAMLLDETGRVLQNQTIAVSQGSFDPVPFHVHLAAPAGVAAMSFSYQGTAIDVNHGGGTPVNFWQYPFH